MRDLLEEAINGRLLVNIWYEPGTRTIECHALGYSSEGHILLRAFQTDGTAMDAACTSVFTTPNPPTGTSGWHFIDIPVSLTSPTHSDVVTACGSACVVTEITAWENILADTTQTQAERLQALSFVVHFIGDIHQPLHCTTRITAGMPNGDAGGNDEWPPVWCAAGPVRAAHPKGPARSTKPKIVIRPRSSSR